MTATDVGPGNDVSVTFFERRDCWAQAYRLWKALFLGLGLLALRSIRGR